MVHELRNGSNDVTDRVFLVEGGDDNSDPQLLVQMNTNPNLLKGAGY
jgi:hypothetical protein